MDLLAWQNLVFLVSLGFGLLLAVSTTMVDLDVDTESPVGPLAVLGFGQCPALVVLMAMGLLFGGGGLMVTLMAGTGLLATTAAFCVALVAMLFGTRFVAAQFHNWAPSTESSAVSIDTMLTLGSVGQAMTDTDRSNGVVQFRHDEDLYQFRAVSDDKTILKGSNVVVVGHDDAIATLVVGLVE